MKITAESEFAPLARGPVGIQHPLGDEAAEATSPQGVGEPCWFHSAAAMASVAFLAPIQATTPNPILLIMSAML